MNGIKNTLKRFVSNKNTVTILGVIAVLVLLYWGYSSQVSNAVKPVTVPVAARTIQPRTQITADMISTIEISQIAVVENVYKDSNQIIGMYSNVNTVIPIGSMFYSEALIEKDNLPDSAFFEIAEDEIPYLFSVNMETTFGNSIFPGSKIDIYMKAVDEDNKIMVGRLLKDVKVLAVKDGAGDDVFENTEEKRQPSYLVFGLPDDIHILLRKAKYLTTGSVELFPVPHGGTVPSEGEIRVSTEYLKDFINSKTIILEGQEETGAKKTKEEGD
ncbi:MAG: hypothetical protein RSB77_01555 [Bacilli bacterium]